MGSSSFRRHNDHLCMELEEACDGGTTCILLDPITGIFYNGDFQLGGWLIIRTSDLQPIEVVWDEEEADEEESPYSNDNGIFQFRIAIGEEAGPIGSIPYPFLKAWNALGQPT